MKHIGRVKRGWTRREMICSAGGFAAAGAAGLVLTPDAISAGVQAGAGSSPRPVPLVHQTDLFRPHVDPDDHFDLACVYALAQRGAFKLLGVLCDYPPAGHAGDPDIAAVAMLNRLTGLSVPLVVGMPQRPVSRKDRMESVSSRDLGGVDWLVRSLRDSPEPVAVSIVGSCRDVALAARREPELFARKCRAIYLNAGTGAPDPQPEDQLEYNVGLDPGSYASVFDCPCPVYWLPCFERLSRAQPAPEGVRRHGTFYQFKMGEVLPQLSASLQRYFLSMLDREPGTRWLESLRAPVDPEKLAAWGRQPRNMWCTAGFCHLAGWSVSGDGALVSLANNDPAAVCRFVPVQVECADDGRTRWRLGSSSPPRFKFEVTDPDHYAGAMTRGWTELVRPLGELRGG